jgi:15-cis-phytoene synthase
MGVMTSPASDSMQEIITRLDQRIQSVDEVRWLSSRYAAVSERTTLIVLYAYYYELARVRVAVTDETLGAIRFQWWRDALAELSTGQIRQHDVVCALAAEIEAGHLTVGPLLELIDQHQAAFMEADRSREPEPFLAEIAASILSSEAAIDANLAEIAREWAAMRRGESIASPQPEVTLPAAIRPALGHFRLRRVWQKTSQPGRIQSRLSVLLAMLTGRI